jgi:hypothetical protein
MRQKFPNKFDSICAVETRVVPLGQNPEIENPLPSSSSPGVIHLIKLALCISRIGFLSDKEVQLIDAGDSAR